MVAGVDKKTPVVFVDTGQHFPETLAYRDELCARLGLEQRRRRRPESGDAGGRRSRRLPLRRAIPTAAAKSARSARCANALEGCEAWITGRKGFQSATRARVPLFEAEGERVKVNPLVGWSATDILAYIREADLPPHSLVARGYPSIGCLPCTSPVRPGEDARAGRWRGRGKTECGIHTEAAERGTGHLMALWRDGGFAEDIWKTLDDAEPIPPTGAIVVSFARWSAERDALSARADPVGVAIAAGTDALEQLAEAARAPARRAELRQIRRRARVLLRRIAARALRLHRRIARRPATCCSTKSR